MRKPAIVVVGSSNTDMIIRLPRLPRPGETLLGGQFFSAAGGNGGNQAVSVPVILNPAPARELPAALLAKVSYLTPNESEAQLLTGIEVSDDSSAGEACRLLHSCGVPTVILTLGSRGAFVSNAGRARLVKGFKVKAVDSTAAGDVFNGALAVAEGRHVDDAVRFANAAGALSVLNLGAQPSAPTRAAIERLIAKRYGVGLQLIIAGAAAQSMLYRSTNQSARIGRLVLSLANTLGRAYKKPL